MFTLNKDFSHAVRNAGVPQGRRTPEQNDNSPLHFDWSKGLDWAQTGLTAAGMIPGLGNIADAANVLVSGGRAGYAKFTGDDEGFKQYSKDAAVNALAMVPGAGLAVGGAKLAKAGLTAAKTTKAVDKTADAVKTTAKVADKFADTKKFIKASTGTKVKSVGKNYATNELKGAEAEQVVDKSKKFASNLVEKSAVDKIKKRPKSEVA